MNPESLSISDIQDIQIDVHRVEELLDCGIFQIRNHRNPLFQSAFIEFMLLLRDLLAKLVKANARLTWTDSVIANKYVKDITDLVSSIRDAACHSDSFKRHLDTNQNRASFGVMAGKGCLMQIDELKLESEYSDDVAFFYGKNRIYLIRGAIRAYKEACIALKPAFKSPWEFEWIEGVIQKRSKSA